MSDQRRAWARRQAGRESRSSDALGWVAAVGVALTASTGWARAPEFLVAGHGSDGVTALSPAWRGLRAGSWESATTTDAEPEATASDEVVAAEAVSTGASTSVVILPLQVDGELPPARQQELRAALEAGLRRGGFALVEPPASVATCETMACRAQVARGVEADYAVAMRVAVERRDYTITLEVVDGEATATVAESRERCEVCGVAEAAEVVDSQAAAIGARLEALTLEPPVIQFESVPPGAVIQLDGEIVGQTPFERVVEPGRHRARAELPGYVSEQREIEAVAGVRAAVEFQLEPMPRPQRNRGMWSWGWASLGVGVAAVGSGVPLIIIDGRINRVSCSGENVDPLGNCKYIYATQAAGIAVAAVGGVLLATGIGLLAGSRRKKKTRTSSPTAAVGVGPGLGLGLGRGGGLLVRGRFGLGRLR